MRLRGSNGKFGDGEGRKRTRASAEEWPRGPASELYSGDNLATGWKLDAYHALEKATDRATATYTAELPSGALVYAEPLVIDAVCLTCHGSVGSDVAAALRERYPDDRATGYALGDFRGIAWAEVSRTP